MRTKIKIVKDPMIIRAEIIEYRPASPELMLLNANNRSLRIRISTDKVETSLSLDANKCNNYMKDGKKIIDNRKNRRELLSFKKQPIWSRFGLIWCRSNKKTRYKDFIYLLRNPHSALLFLNSDNLKLKRLANAILKGYRVIFPREVRYNGKITQLESKH